MIPALREQAVRRYAVQAVDASRPALAQQLAVSAARALALFAGDDAAPDAQGRRHGGLQAISDFMDASVPEAERARAG